MPATALALYQPLIDWIAGYVRACKIEELQA